MPKTLTMRLDEETYQTFVRAAKAERRSLANLVENAALQHPLQSSFVDDTEMAEIASRPELVLDMPESAEAGSSRPYRIYPLLLSSSSLAAAGFAEPGFDGHDLVRMDSDRGSLPAVLE